jgi:hypothetical protein
MAKEPAKVKKLPVDLSLLTEDDRKALAVEARKSVLEEMKQDARDKYFADEMAKLRREQTPADRLVEITIDVAPFVPYIALDGVQFFHGYTYPVTVAQAAVINEQMWRSWQHQDEIDGRNRSEAYRRPQNRRIGRQDAGTSTRGFATGVTVNAEI